MGEQKVVNAKLIDIGSKKSKSFDEVHEDYQTLRHKRKLMNYRSYGKGKE